MRVKVLGALAAARLLTASTSHGAASATRPEPAAPAATAPAPAATAPAPATTAPAPAAKKAKAEGGDKNIARGRNVLRVAGCNDCHSPGYAAAAGKVPEEKWLVGDGIGRRGSWGTTYPANLRLLLGGLSEEEWVAKARALKTRPPMPWYGLREMRKPDLVAVYRYVRKLGPSGLAAPAFVPAGTEPKTPFVLYPSAKP